MPPQYGKPATAQRTAIVVGTRGARLKISAQKRLIQVWESERYICTLFNFAVAVDVGKGRVRPSELHESLEPSPFSVPFFLGQKASSPTHHIGLDRDTTGCLESFP